MLECARFIVYDLDCESNDEISVKVFHFRVNKTGCVCVFV